MNQLRALPFFIVLAIIIFSGLRPEPIPQVFDDQDKLHHMCGFAAMMFTLRLAFPQWRAFWAIAISLTAGLLIEVGQSFIPNRTASGADMVANSVGVMVGWACWHLVNRWYLRQRGANAPSAASEHVDNR